MYILPAKGDYIFFENSWSFCVGRDRSQEVIKKILSHFYKVKKVVQLIQSLGRLVLAVVDQANWLNLYKTGLLFLLYKNGSKIIYDLFRPIPIHTEGPRIFKKNVIALPTYPFYLP